MKELKKPNVLRAGDTIATVSLSWGGAGDEDLRWRYEIGKKRLEEEFGLKVIEMEHTLAGTDYLYEHPEMRAKDLMDAFKDPEIKGIIACIGGNESIRLLPYIDFDIIKANPKLFSGYSDSTVTHFMCLKAGISSIYGPTILSEFAENVNMMDYTRKWIEKSWFHPDPIGLIPASDIWTSEYLPWEEQNRNCPRQVKPHHGYKLLQGSGVAAGRLIGGCFDVLEMIKGTTLFPAPDEFAETILFIETSEEMLAPSSFEDGFRWYGTMGILQRINGLIVGKPYDGKYEKEYEKIISKVLKECGRETLPVLMNMNFGHTAPMICIPYGAMARIDCGRKEFSILEAAVK